MVIRSRPAELMATLPQHSQRNRARLCLISGVHESCHDDGAIRILSPCRLQPGIQHLIPARRPKQVAAEYVGGYGAGKARVSALLYLCSVLWSFWFGLQLVSWISKLSSLRLPLFSKTSLRHMSNDHQAIDDHNLATDLGLRNTTVSRYTYPPPVLLT